MNVNQSRHSLSSWGLECGWKARLLRVLGDTMGSLAIVCCLFRVTLTSYRMYALTIFSGSKVGEWCPMCWISVSKILRFVLRDENIAVPVCEFVCLQFMYRKLDLFYIILYSIKFCISIPSSSKFWLFWIFVSKYQPFCGGFAKAKIYNEGW